VVFGDFGWLLLGCWGWVSLWLDVLWCSCLVNFLLMLMRLLSSVWDG